ncbi:MAG: T9SS type A sorting domain-containing protein, partial [Bacteroidia bacterium]|nr:T9SS type A sorting domain-containing protein [Bacteroidia bacterium]
PCDTLGVGLGEPGKEDVFFQAWYNREWDLVHVNATGLKGRTGRLRLFDLEGRLVYEKKIEVIPGGYVTTEIGMQGLANGLYMVSLQSEKERMSGKIMKL